MCEGDLPAAVLAGSSESWSKPPALGNELPPFISESSDRAPDVEREAERFPAPRNADGAPPPQGSG